MAGEVLLSERLHWLRTAKGEVAGLLAAAEGRLQQFVATTRQQEETLFKRVRLTFEAERSRAHAHHHDLTQPIRHNLDTIEQQLVRLEGLADNVVNTHTSPCEEEMKRLLTEELPLPLPLPSAGKLQAAWERTCPPPRWRLTTCDFPAEQSKIGGQSTSTGYVTGIENCSSRQAFKPQWPTPERAAFKGGTSLPMPEVDSASSGPEEILPVRLVDASQSDSCVDDALPADRRCPVSRLKNNEGHRRRQRCSSGSYTSPRLTTELSDTLGNEGRVRELVRDPRRVSENIGEENRSRNLSSNWVKNWLDSNELHDLLGSTAEIEAIRRLERKRSVAKAKYRMGLRTER